MDNRAEKISEIAKLNDRFRQIFWGGEVYMTAGVTALSDTIICKIFAAVQNYNAFTPDNNPHGERDFGKFKIENYEFIWKIDYYDPTHQYLSEDPTNPAVTLRVMTIMLAEEY